jgi:hypothetical protein
MNICILLQVMMDCRVLKKMKRFITANVIANKTFVLLVLIGLVSIALMAASAQAAPSEAYLMAHFTGESANGEQIYLAAISPLDGYDKPRIYYATTTDFVNLSALAESWLVD